MQGREHQVTRKSRFHGDVGGLGVTDFADHHDIGRLTENRAEGRGEVESDILVDLNLVDAAHLVFDRVFNSNELFVGRVDLAQTGVKGRRLT